MTDALPSGFMARVAALPPDRHVLLVDAGEDLSVLAALDVVPLALDPSEPLPEPAELHALIFRTVCVWPSRESSRLLELARRLFEIDPTVQPDVRMVFVPESFDYLVARFPSRMVAVFGIATVHALLDAARSWSPPKADPSRWTADELLRSSFPAPRYAVEQMIVSDGLTVVGGAFKAGKSLLLLGCAQAIAAGVPVLGRNVQAGRVLYLDLESGPRRVADRLRQQHAKPGLPLVFRFNLRPLDDGGFDELVALIDAEQPAVVILDTLASSKTGKIDENAAGPMADLMNALHQLAQDKHVALVVVHHHGKAGTGDAGRDLRGSSAIGAAADVFVGLYRQDGGGGVLKIDGRDFPHQEIALRFDGLTCCWQVSTDPRIELREDTDERVIAALRELGGSGDAEQVAEKTDLDRTRASRVLNRLFVAGKLTAHREGQRRVFTLIDPPDGEAAVLAHPAHPAPNGGGGVPPVRGVPGSAVSAAFPEAEQVPDETGLPAAAQQEQQP